MHFQNIDLCIYTCYNPKQQTIYHKLINLTSAVQVWSGCQLQERKRFAPQNLCHHIFTHVSKLKCKAAHLLSSWSNTFYCVRTHTTVTRVLLRNILCLNIDFKYIRSLDGSGTASGRPNELISIDKWWSTTPKHRASAAAVECTYVLDEINI